MPLSRPRIGDSSEINLDLSQRFIDEEKERLDLEKENRMLAEALSKETHLRERADKSCEELRKRLQRASESERSLKSKLDRLSHDSDLGNKLEVIRLDHLVAQLSSQIEAQEELLRENEEREAEYEKMTLKNMDKLQAEWLKVLSENHLRQKESHERIEDLEARLRRAEERAAAASSDSSAALSRQLAQARERCALLEEELAHARQAGDKWRRQHEATEEALREAERQAGAGHEAQEVLPPHHYLQSNPTSAPNSSLARFALRSLVAPLTPPSPAPALRSLLAQPSDQPSKKPPVPHSDVRPAPRPPPAA